MLLFGPMGWARPVPVDPYQLRHLRRDWLLVAAAGPATNFLLALALGAIFQFAPGELTSGSLHGVLLRAVYINLGLAFFNLIPLPPLDGSRVLASVLPGHLSGSYARLEPYGATMLMVLILVGAFTHVSPIWAVIGPFVHYFLWAFTGAGGG
jgi:Zn-dependent protease